MGTETKYHSHGKFLITGEYLVLHGAKALAVPLLKGQSLEVRAWDEPFFLWESWHERNCWFRAVFDPLGPQVLETTDEEKAVFLLHILRRALHMAGNKKDLSRTRIISCLDFSTSWGMGSSSSLISNIAWWLKIDPFRLHFEVSRGSGYDIACARADQPLIYQLDGRNPMISKIDFMPGFADKLCFIYSGRKQDSAASVSNFKKSEAKYSEEVSRVSRITEQMVLSADQESFNRLMEEHEELISHLLQAGRVRDRFPDFNGSLKSLGAWGGDFFLASSNQGRQYISGYFTRRGYPDQFFYNEIVMNAS